MPEFDEAVLRLTLRFPEGGLVSDVVELGEPVETSFLGRPRPGRLANGPWGAALSEWAGQPLRLVAPAAGPGRRRSQGVCWRQPVGGQAVRQERFDAFTRAIGVGATRRQTLKLLMLLLLPERALAHAQAPDLSGLWLAGNGQKVRIRQAGTEVVGSYAGLRVCAPSGPAPGCDLEDHATTSTMFRATLAGDQLAGELAACRLSEGAPYWRMMPVRMSLSADGKTLAGTYQPPEGGSLPVSLTLIDKRAEAPANPEQVGQTWWECETSAFGEYCGPWTRKGNGPSWRASWTVRPPGRTAEPECVTVSTAGSTVTVTRGSFAEYTGTLNAAGTEISGTVTFPFGSGTWKAIVGRDTPPAAVEQAPDVPRDERYFDKTGYRVDDDAMWGYFQASGGVSTFGYPVSRTFKFLGCQVQVFQRHVMQRCAGGSPALLNLLDPDLLPYTRFNGSTFPPVDDALKSQTPKVGDPDYATKILQFVNDNAPDTWDGDDVGFGRTFRETVPPDRAGTRDPGILGLLALEVWGAPISRPMRDPSNPQFVYLRFQRGIMHYQANRRVTEGILLADYLKALLIGTARTDSTLPPDLRDQAQSSPLLEQYCPGQPQWLCRPNALLATELTFAFESVIAPPTPPRTPPPGPPPTSQPCPDDVINFTTMDAALAALQGGASDVALGTTGCFRYQRQVTAGRVVSETYTAGGKTQVAWQHGDTQSQATLDGDLDGFAEWRAVVTRGAQVNDQSVRVDEYSAASKSVVRRTTYQRQSDVLHVAIEQADNSGTLRPFRTYDTSLRWAQADARAFANPSFSAAAQSGCSAQDYNLIKQRLAEAYERGVKCLQDNGAAGLAATIKSYWANTIQIVCEPLDLIAYMQVWESWIDRLSGLHPNEARLHIDPVRFRHLDDNPAHPTPDAQRMLLMHELGHLSGPHDTDVQNNTPPDAFGELDQPESCAQMCFNDPHFATKCHCARCLGTDMCDKRCDPFRPCLHEKSAFCRCLFRKKWYPTHTQCEEECPSGPACFASTPCQVFDYSCKK